MVYVHKYVYRILFLEGVALPPVLEKYCKRTMCYSLLLIRDN